MTRGIFNVGDRVTVGPNPGTRLEPGSGYVDADAANKVGTIVADPATYGDEPDQCPLVRFDRPLRETGSEQFIHQAHLTQVES